MNNLRFAVKSLRFPQSIPSMIARSYASSSNDLVLVDVNSKGHAIVTLNRAPVNSLSLELLTTLSNTLDDLQKNKTRGMILTSSSNTVFSAGLDIMEMYDKDEKRMKEFWRALQDVWIRLYGSFFPTAAAINGHAPAGGCLLSIGCEYRVMCPKFTIGLNETKLGIVAPWWFMEAYKKTISSRVAEMALTEGAMFTTEEALKLGLIDEIANDKADAISKCESFLDKFKKIPVQARGLTKQQFRGQDIKNLELGREVDINNFVAAASHPSVQKSLGLYLESLKNKK